VTSTLVFGAQQIGALGAGIWIREWANQYQVQSTSTILGLSAHKYVESAVSTIGVTSAKLSTVQPYFDPNKFSIMANVAPEVDVSYYLGIYAVIGVAGMLIAFFKDRWLFYGSVTASWSIHQRLIDSVSRAKFKFFDVTPLGQLMNRFSKDLEAVDQEVAPIAIGVISCALAIVVTIGVISVITPGFLVAAFFIGGMYFFCGQILFTVFQRSQEIRIRPKESVVPTVRRNP